MSTTKVFVYGTLKKNFHNHRLLKDAKFIGEFRTEPCYQIFCNGSFPYLIEASKNGDSIYGEVYEITTAERNACDRLEGHPRMYKRQPIKLIGIEDAEAYVYQHEVSGCRPCGNCWPENRAEAV